MKYIPAFQSLLAFTILTGALAMAGCGGGEGWPDIPPRTASPRMTLRWCDRSRVIRGPGSALSVRITMVDAAPAGGDVNCDEDRRSDSGAYTQSFVMDERCLTGSFRVNVQYFAESRCAGDVVGSGTAYVHIEPDGSGIDAIGITNTIHSVTVNPHKDIPAGQSGELTFTARDPEGSIVGVTPGSAIWTQIDGFSVLALTRDGIVSGIRPGVAHVKASVDGTASPIVQVIVTDPPSQK